jgi:dienelactone hydrolase
MQATARPARLAALLAAALLVGCAGQPLVPWSADTPPLVLAPAASAGVVDKRARFREIYCAVLESHGHELPDYRACDDALTRVGNEPAAATARPVELGPSRRKLVAAIVPGIGYDCFAKWLAPAGTTAAHLRRFGYDLVAIKVDALSSTATNARQIRDAVMAMDAAEPSRIVLIGYSKGAPDVLDAIVRYPEIRPRVAAVVSAAGAVGGSPLANDAEQYQAELLQHFPGAACDAGDGGAVEALRPATRRAWLAANPLPKDVPMYSLVTFPKPERISSILEGSYNKLARIDGRNDSQMIFYDQIIPDSSLVGFVNADHWALVVPIARQHDTIGSLFVTQNAYPREAMTEALLRFLEEDLGGR